MRILISEDDFTSRKFMPKFLSAYGECDLAINGMEALEAFMMAWDEGKPYDLISNRQQFYRMKFNNIN